MGAWLQVSLLGPGPIAPGPPDLTSLQLPTILRGRPLSPAGLMVADRGRAEFSEVRGEVPAKPSALRKQIKDLLESANSRFCYLLILLYRASAHPYSPDNLPITL
jgi:hypothetical protein